MTYLQFFFKLLGLRKRNILFDSVYDTSYNRNRFLSYNRYIGLKRKTK